MGASLAKAGFLSRQTAKYEISGQKDEMEMWSGVGSGAGEPSPLGPLSQFEERGSERRDLELCYE
jgi:hypothetical protein